MILGEYLDNRYTSIQCNHRTVERWPENKGTQVDIDPMPERLGFAECATSPTDQYESERRKITEDWQTGGVQNQHPKNKGDANKLM